MKQTTLGDQCFRRLNDSNTMEGSKFGAKFSEPGGSGDGKSFVVADKPNAGHKAH